MIDLISPKKVLDSPARQLRNTAERKAEPCLNAEFLLSGSISKLTRSEVLILLSAGQVAQFWSKLEKAVLKLISLLCQLLWSFNNGLPRVSIVVMKKLASAKIKLLNSLQVAFAGLAQTIFPTFVVRVFQRLKYLSKIHF